jgi:flavin-dependent dehydrogenase
MSAEKSVDVVVVGGGVAGSSAAIVLATQGCRVLVVSLPTRRPERAGESLAPAANAIMRELGVWESFLSTGPVQCHLNRSIWGGSRPAHFDFMLDPRGPAWHIDRTSFQATLAASAQACGAVRVVARRVQALERHGGTWRVALTAERACESRVVSCAYLVDASGRSSALARKQTARRLASDRQIAIVTEIGCVMDSEDACTLVESVENGWWYSAGLSGRRLMLAFMTDPDLHPTDPDERFHLARALTTTDETRRRVATRAIATEDARLRIVSANGARLQPAHGPRWLAVGDAALTCDPIVGHGLVIALASGRDGARAVVEMLNGRCSAADEYAERLDHAFAIYSRLRADAYQAEARWSHAPYWQRRRLK